MIIAVGACLLMIAGEFDLSVGSMIGFAGMMIADLFGHDGLADLAGDPDDVCHVPDHRCAQRLHRHRTGLPSFIVTLAFLFILRGFTIFLPQTGENKTIIGGIRDAAEGDWLAPLFGGKIVHVVFPMALATTAHRYLRARHPRANRWSTGYRC
jgi:simple sugar transport system permease protein